MATGKRFYWIKVKKDFIDSDKVDFLMSQKDGANYIVLYQMLCLKCINTDGALTRQIGEVIIPYDADKITRDCKWFSIDTVRVALELFRKLGMIYEESDGTLRISEFGNMVGTETDWAEKKRRQRVGTGPVNGLLDGGDIVPIDTDTEKEKELKDIDSHLVPDGTVLDSEREPLKKQDTTEKTSDTQRIVDAWNAMSERSGLPKVKKLTDARLIKLKKRVSDYGEPDIIEAINTIPDSSFLRGDSKCGWRATFDFILERDAVQKILDGNYSDRGQQQFPKNTEQGTDSEGIIKINGKQIKLQ